MELSIIIPMYNVEAYIEECIDSILPALKKKSNIEVILIDDGSTDNSLSIAKRYEDIDDKIRLYSQINQGLAASRNKGIANAKGEYLIFVDSDDKISIDKLFQLLNKVKKYNADVGRGKYIKFNDGECVAINNFPEKKETYKLFKGTEYVSQSVLNKEYEIVSCTSVYKKEYLMKNEIYFNENIYFEDHDFTMRVLLETEKKIVISDIDFYYYRQREGSITKSVDYKKIRSFIKVLLNQKEYIEKKSLRHVKKAGYQISSITMEHLIQFAYRNLELTEIMKIRKQLDNNNLLSWTFINKIIHHTRIKSTLKTLLFCYFPTLLSTIYKKNR